MNIHYIGGINSRLAMKYLSLLALSTALLIAVVGCKKDEEPEFETPATKMSGKVNLQDKWGNVVFENRAGTEITLSGQFQNWNVETDNTGRYEFSGIEDGNYAITIAKDGYTSMQINNIQFSRNSPQLAVEGEYQLLPTITLGQRSESFFDSTMVEVIYNTEIIYIDTFVDPWITDLDTTTADILFSARIYPETPVPNAQYGYRLFIGTAPNTGINNYIATMHGTTPALTGEIDVLWTQSQWQNIGFNPGDNFVVRVYGDAVNPLSYNTASGVPVFPNLSDSLGLGWDVIVPFN